MIYGRDGMRYGVMPSSCATKALPFLRQATTILEIGSGYGRDALWLAEQQYGTRVLAVDSSPMAIRTLQRLSAERGISNIEGVAEDVIKWSERRGCDFEAVYAHFFFHLFVDSERRQLFDVARRLLRRNGTLVSSFMSVSDAKNGRGPEVEAGTYACYPDRPWHLIHFFNKDELMLLHESHGFRVEQFEEVTEAEMINGMTESSTYWFVVARKAKD
jgi:cyclopropane fatty-acyl-phospholipid synthase-like methyltransferase